MSKTMADGPSWLYPGRVVDRSFRARVARAIGWRFEKLRRRFPPLLRIVREIHAASGKSTWVVGAEVVESWIRNGITPPRFAVQSLWAVAPERRAEFVWAEEMDAFFAATIDPEDRALMRDKAAFADHAYRVGIPCLPTLAVINRREKPLGSRCASIDDPEALSSALIDLTASTDVFLKPSVGKQGQGVYRVSRAGRAIDADGREIALDELVKRVFDYRHPVGAFGYLAQAALESHPELVELSGTDALPTLRVLTAVRNGTSGSLCAFLKIPAPGRLTNNFLSGTTGTFVSALDLATGCLGELVGILRPGNRFVVERTKAYPVTGRRICGRELPAWREALHVAERGAALHPRTPTLGWDLSRGPTGWRVLEVNTSWGPGGPQVAGGRGLRPDLVRLFPEYWS